MTKAQRYSEKVDVFGYANLHFLSLVIFFFSFISIFSFFFYFVSSFLEKKNRPQLVLCLSLGGYSLTRVAQAYPFFFFCYFCSSFFSFFFSFILSSFLLSFCFVFFEVCRDCLWERRDEVSHRFDPWQGPLFFPLSFLVWLIFLLDLHYSSKYIQQVWIYIIRVVC